MNVLLLLQLFFFGFAFGFFGFFSEKAKVPHLTTYPAIQVVYEYETVIINCIDSEHGIVRWEREKGFMSKRAIQVNGKLIIEHVRYEDRGTYICYSDRNKSSEKAVVRVKRKTLASTKTPVLKSFSYSSFTSGFPNTPKPPFPTTALLDTPYPCLYGICNGTCCENKLDASLFDCANGQKINKTLVCNRNNDCEDGSDESICDPWPSKITVLPKHKVEVYCGEDDDDTSGTLILECQSVGHPTPVIRWKKYDGHVPSKCQQFSKRGHGILTCPNFQQSDQGAYSCVAENPVKSAESQPKSIAKCSNRINCRGFRVINQEQIEHCLECYCSGKTTQCQGINSNPTAFKIPFPQTETEIFAKENGEVLFVPTQTNPSPDSKIRNSAQEINYCSLSESELSELSFLKSFGRNIIFPRHKGKTDFMEKAPDLILQGNGLSLMYTATLLSPPKGNIMDVSARLWPGNWHHLNKKVAHRLDLMKVLSKVEALLIRCEYEQGKSLIQNKTATIIIESSTITDFKTSVSYVEKCTCPTGYDGLSCESCATGYKKKPQGSGFICEKIYVPPVVCTTGYIGNNCSNCDTLNGYHRYNGDCVKSVCHPEGSVSVFLNSFKKCTCRERVTGELCDRCEIGSFYLHKERGCLKCWCNGVTNECNSSKLYRTIISNIPRGGYNSSDGRNFWLLPEDFRGNRLTSYGGHLNYTMKYKPLIPKQNAYLTVEFLSADDVTLVYTHPTVDSSTTKDEKSWSVPLTELHWRKSDKGAVTRGEYLTVLSRIKAIYIESPYHLSSGQANLTSTRMTSASTDGDGDNILALAVEQCNCPRGYTGLSCESCSDGYYKKRNGTITQCVKCNCTYCDPDFGCQNCPPLTYRDNPEEEKMPVCKPCLCNGRGVSCVKDDHNQIFCRCKPGFTGMHCENTIPEKRGRLTITISPRRVKNKKTGTVISFNCSLTSSEEMTFSSRLTYRERTRNDSYILLSRGETLSEVFEVTLETGIQTVECIVHDAEGRLAGQVISVVEDLITEIKPVKITNCYSDRIDVKESESKDIICEATGSPTPMINWYKNENGHGSEKLDTSEGVHSIENASLKDNGTIYTCIAENSEADKDTCTKVLIVREKCEVINILPKSVRAIEQDTISLQCTTTAKGPVVWSVLDTFLNKEKNISSPRIQVEGGILRINNASLYDSGTYICTANGQYGKINETVVVSVEEKRVPPTVNILEYDKKLKVGESFEAHCVVTGKPTPTVTWAKVNGSLYINVRTLAETLTINSAHVKNSGIYVCEAKSISGNASSYISITVEEDAVAPRINISEEKISAHVGEEVSLSCLATGNPRPQITWYTQGISFTTSRVSDSMILIAPMKSIKEETKFKVTKEMDGLGITCYAYNVAGAVQKTAIIKVLEFTGGINETVEFVPIGTFFEMRCDFPSELKWEKETGHFNGDECIFPKSLIIPSVQIQHNGTYQCKDETEVKKKINLIVIGFVPKFSKIAQSYLVLPVLSKSVSEFRVELTFNPSHENGVLLQKENHKLDVYLEKRRIHLVIFSTDGSSLDIVMNKPIELGRWYLLVVYINTKYADITMYDENSFTTTVYDRKTEHFRDFNVELVFGSENFFLGGPIPKSRHDARTLFRRFPHFDGCISRLLINRHEFDIVKEGQYSHNVTLCRKCSELENPCGERGKCMDAPTQRGFTCVCPNDHRNKNESCPSSCAGRGCETQLDLCALLNPCNGYIHKCFNNVHNLQCVCAYGYSGTTCERVQEYSFCAKENGYVKLPSMLLERHLGVPEVIRMSFTLQKLSGQLLWQGDKLNHLSIAAVDGKLEYVYLNQHSKLKIRTEKELALDEKYTLSIRRSNNTALLELNSGDTIREGYQNSTQAYYTNRVTGDIYLGNAPKNYIGSPVGLHGCIHYISFGENAKINLPEKEIERVNIFQPQKLSSDDSSDESVDYNEADSDVSAE